MFVKQSRIWCSKDGAQHAKGPFLVLFWHPAEVYAGTKLHVLKAIIRVAHLSQCGPWMMGNITAAGTTIQVSGDYGADGLPINLDRVFMRVSSQTNLTHGVLQDAVISRLVPVPAYIGMIYWEGEHGHNTAGTEAPTMRQWALDNFKALGGRP